MINDTLAQLKAEFVIEALDLGDVHLAWSCRHLQEGRYPQALAAFSKLVTAVRAAAPAMVAIRNMVDGDKLTKESAAEYRRDRDGRAAA